MIRVAFRFDDPGLGSDHALEREILARFAAARIPLTCAVVPYRCNGEATEALTAEAVPHLVQALNAGAIEVALHGYCHRCLARLPDGNSTEFAGIDPARQARAIAAGRDRLAAVFGTAVTGFVPPWNSYDAATLEALRAAGFDWLSADWALVTREPLPVTVIPHTCGLAELAQAVADARQFPAAEPLVVPILHHFDFTTPAGTAAALESLAGQLAWVRAQPDLICTTLGSAAARFSPVQCRRNLRLAQWRRGLHWRLQRLLPRYTLLAGGRTRFAVSVGGQALGRLPRAITG